MARDRRHSFLSYQHAFWSFPTMQTSRFFGASLLALHQSDDCLESEG